MRTLTKGEDNRKPFDIEKAAMAAQPSVEELAERMVDRAEGHNDHLFVGDGRSERCRTCQLSESEGRHKLEPKPEDAPWHHLRHGFFQMPGPTGGGPLEDRCSNCGNTEADDIHNEVVGV